MARPCSIKLSPGQQQELLQAAERSREPEFRDGCRAILALAAGQTRKEVAAIMGVHPGTIGRWAALYRRESLAGLRAPAEDRRGCPRKLQVEDLCWLKETVLTPPKDLGYAFTTWSLPRLASYLEKQRGVQVKSHYIGHLLRQMGLTRLRPKHTLKGKRDEAEHATAKAQLVEIKRDMASSPIVPISQDEAEFHLYPYLVALWGVVGSPQPQVPTPGKNEKRVLYCQWP